MTTRKTSADLSKLSYGLLKKELDEIIGWFSGEQFDLDAAETKYARGAAIITELNTRLTAAKLKIDKINVPD